MLNTHYKDSTFIIELLGSEIDEELEMDILDFINSEIAIEVKDLFKYFKSISCEDILYWLEEYEAKWNPSHSYLTDMIELQEQYIQTNYPCFGYIYQFLNKINGKSYIGQTTNIERRFAQHKRSINSQSNSLFYKAIRKYGWSNFEFNVLDTAHTQEELNEKESWFIDKFRSYSKLLDSKGYNLTLGGDGQKGVSDVLTVDDVVKIKELIRDTNKSINQIAKDFKVGSSTVFSIYWGNNWNYVEVDGFTPKMPRADTICKGEDFPKASINNNDAKTIKTLLRDTDFSHSKISKLIGCKTYIVSHIYSGNAWEHIDVQGYSPKMDRVKKNFKKREVKLTVVEVIEIKKMLMDDLLTHKEIANKFNVSRETITSINRGRSYYHIKVVGFKPSNGNGIRKGEKVKNSKLNLEQVKDIKKMINAGIMSMRQIAFYYKVSPETIRKIKNGLMWSNIES